MNVTITGGLGFIGSHVVERLLASGHRVVIVDSLEERVHHGNPPNVPKDVTFYPMHAGDLPAEACLDAEVLIHLAAQVGVADSMTDPLRYLRENTLETSQMLCGLARSATIRRLVVASSMSVYGEGGLLVRESDPVFPASVYGLSKFDQERLCLLWGRQHDVKAYALRFFNVFGERQCLDNPYTGVLAIFSRRILHGQRPMVYEDGQQSRDFIHVSDVADAVVRAAVGDHHAVPTAYNICTGVPTTVETAAWSLIRALGAAALEPDINHQERPGDIRFCTGDPDLAAAQYGWRSKVTFEEGIHRYASWLSDVDPHLGAEVRR